jgi:uncharacterized protein
MLIEKLDGFLAGMIVCPNLILPSCWMAHIWRESGGEDHAPVFAVNTRNDDVLWEMWVEGFRRAMMLYPASWSAVVEIGDADAIAALRSNIAIATGKITLPKPERNCLIDDAPDLIPELAETLEGLERHQRMSISNSRNCVHIAGNKPSNVLGLVQIEFHQQIIFTRGGVDFGRNLGIRNGGCDVIGISEFTFDLDKYCSHSSLYSCGHHSGHSRRAHLKARPGYTAEMHAGLQHCNAIERLCPRPSCSCAGRRAKHPGSD